MCKPYSILYLQPNRHIFQLKEAYRLYNKKIKQPTCLKKWAPSIFHGGIWGKSAAGHTLWARPGSAPAPHSPLNTRCAPKQKPNIECAQHSIFHSVFCLFGDHNGWGSRISSRFCAQGCFCGAGGSRQCQERSLVLPHRKQLPGLWSCLLQPPVCCCRRKTAAQLLLTSNLIKFSA